MTLALWIVLTPLTLWVVFCALVWIYWFLLGGNKTDYSGDGSLAVFFLPVIPFMTAYEWIRTKIG